MTCSQNLRHCMFGDAASDIDAARVAGIVVVSVAWGCQSVKLLAAQPASCLVDSPSALAQACDALLMRGL